MVVRSSTSLQRDDFVVISLALYVQISYYIKGSRVNPKKTDDFDRLSAEGFIKSTDLPVSTLGTDKKATLNRKGNEYFNKGDIETARRIFITTGYSDGLSRIGDHYADKGQELEALKLYWLAHNKRKAEPILEKLARLIETII